ncbi:unnamed protein product (macronuclear) [Paramecium tetraurelia]|uniref:RNA-dependent RNA polymerase n=1 Tax=Paramecium tetraurelia TaxID=5888 RepID=A0DMU3_PARTE|nr:uncharacterized protein GSPATT00018564001 [Paramecium tetraurelia]CAK84360.1 unnamed protein product [Paramecium tetraurelia]|eukprot:XP_001451757.1 hypothetical protein (macronuclear) [Paramecium tetraurelia strain d4-2]
MKQNQFTFLEHPPSSENDYYVRCRLQNITNKQVLSTTATIIYDKVKLALNEILPDHQIYVHLLKIQIQQVEFKFEENIQNNAQIQGDANYNNYTQVSFLETLLNDYIDKTSDSIIKQSEINYAFISPDSQTDLEYNICYGNEIDTRELDNLIQTLSRLITCQSVQEFNSIAIYQKEADQKQNNSVLITFKLTKECFMNLKFYSFNIQPDSQPVTINFQQAEILTEHQEHSDFIPILNEHQEHQEFISESQYEFNRCIKVTDLNFLYITAEDLIQMKLDIPKTKPIQLYLSPYFQYQDLGKLQLETYLIYNNKQTQQEESIIIIINIVAKLKLKIEIQLNNCEYCHIVNNAYQTHLYFKLNHPPICSAALFDKTKIDFLDTQTQWTRIENIYLNTYFQKYQNILEKFVILNNTIIEIQFNNYKSCNEVRLLNQLQLRLKQKMILYDSKIQLNIFKQTERNSKFDTLQQQLDKSNLSFEQKYNFICILSQNRIIDCHHLKTLLILMCKQQQNSDYILDSVFQSFMRLSQNLSSSIRISDQNNRNLFIFQKELKELSCQVQQNACLQRPILLKQARLTPSGYIPMISKPEKPKLLTTVFQNQNFVKLSLRDDNGKLIKKNRSNFGEFFKLQLTEGFTICSEQWKFLGWNNKELRSNIIWMNKVSNKELDNYILANFKQNSTLQQKAEVKSRFRNFFIDGLTTEFKQLIIVVIRNQINENNFSQFGQISRNLIDKIREIFMNQEISVVKVVFNGVQYILQLNNNLKDNIIQLNSQYKIFSSFNDQITIIDYNKYRGAFLNRGLIRLFYQMGVKEDVFIQLLNWHLGQISKAFIVRSVSLDLKSELCGLSPIIEQINVMKRNYLNEKNCLFIQKVYEKLKLLEIQQLKQKYNILVEKAERLFGVVDQYGILNEGEVICIRKPNDQVQYLEGKLIVVEDCNQDRQKTLNVIGLSRLEVIGRLKNKTAYDEYINCIIFSNKQQNSTPFCTNTYFVSWDKRLISKRQKINKTKGLEEFEFLKFDQGGLTDYLCDFLNYQFSQDVECNHIGLQQHEKQDRQDIFKIIDQYMVDKPQLYQTNQVNIDERFIYRFYWIKEENNYEQYVRQCLGEMHIIKALKCLNHITDTFNAWMKLYDIKDEYEMYTGYYESKMNEENQESFQEIMMLNLGQLKLELYNILSQIEQERLIQIWIIHFLVIYLPNEKTSESHLLERIVKCVKNQVKNFDDCKFLCSRLTNRSQQWFKGCSWYFFRREIINFEQISKNE